MHFSGSNVWILWRAKRSRMIRVTFLGYIEVVQRRLIAGELDFPASKKNRVETWTRPCCMMLKCLVLHRVWCFIPFLHLLWVAPAKVEHGILPMAIEHKQHQHVGSLFLHKTCEQGSCLDSWKGQEQWYLSNHTVKQGNKQVNLNRSCRHSVQSVSQTAKGHLANEWIFIRTWGCIWS